MFKTTVLLAGFAALFAAQGALAAGHVIQHAGDKPSVVGSAKIFTGKVRQDPIASADQYSHNGITVVTFEPGARTFWHSHPAGQRLLIVSGKGFVGTADGVTHVVRAGDYVWCPPEIEHWHGATPDTAMSHIAMTNNKDGNPVEKPYTHITSKGLKWLYERMVRDGLIEQQQDLFDKTA